MAYLKRGPYKRYGQDAMTLGVQMVGEGKSISESARLAGVKRSTLSDVVRGASVSITINQLKLHDLLWELLNLYKLLKNMVLHV